MIERVDNKVAPMTLFNNDRVSIITDSKKCFE